MKDSERALSYYQQINKDLVAEVTRLKQELANRHTEIITLNELLIAERDSSALLKSKITELLANVSKDFLTFQKQTQSLDALIEQNVSRVVGFTNNLYPSSSPFQSTGLSENLSRPTRSQNKPLSTGNSTPERHAKVGPRIKTPYGIVQSFSIRVPRLEQSLSTASSSIVLSSPRQQSSSTNESKNERPVIAQRPVRNLSARRSLDYEDSRGLESNADCLELIPLPETSNGKSGYWN